MLPVHIWKWDFFFLITFILLWWDFLKPALFNSGDAVLLLLFIYFYEKHHLLNHNVINLTFQHFPSEQDSAQQTWWYSCWNVRCLTKGLIRQFKKKTNLCVRGVWNTLIVILDAGIFMSQINSSLVSQCRWKEAMWLSQEVVWNAAVNLEA